MKIIYKDNYGSENIADVLICENINKDYGEDVCNFLNKTMPDNEFYELVNDDYVLWRGMEEFV